MILPLILSPVFKTAIWAGTGLSKHYNIDYPISEAWVLSLRDNNICRILNFPFKGLLPIGIEEYNKTLDNFPILIKLIDAAQPLSVQVHPDDSYAGKNGERFGKTEMWYIIDAKKGARIVYGLKDGISRCELENAVNDGMAEECLNFVDVKAGQTYFIPAGLVHAIGKDILIAEIQQNSDTTYRLYDYKRKDKNGNERELHIKEALDTAKLKTPEISIPTSPTIAECEYFKVEKISSFGKSEFKNNKNFHLLILNGNGKINYAEYSCNVGKYSSILLLDGCCNFTLLGNFEIIKTTW